MEQNKQVTQFTQGIQATQGQRPLESSQDAINRNIDNRALEVVKKYMSSSAFTDRKISDMPFDSYSMVSRRFVTLNGATGSRPTSSILGQFYFDTTLGQPVWWNGTTWVDATGTPS